MQLHPSGALFWRGASTLILGDLHLEKASSYHRSGQFLPPYDMPQTLANLPLSVMTCNKGLILLGDVFHDGNAWHRMSSENRDLLIYSGRA